MGAWRSPVAPTWDGHARRAHPHAYTQTHTHTRTSSRFGRPPFTFTPVHACPPSGGLVDAAIPGAQRSAVCSLSSARRYARRRRRPFARVGQWTREDCPRQEALSSCGDRPGERHRSRTMHAAPLSLTLHISYMRAIDSAHPRPWRALADTEGACMDRALHQCGPTSDCRAACARACADDSRAL